MNIDDAMKELEKVEKHIETEQQRIDGLAGNANPEWLVSQTWYQTSLRELQPYYVKATFLHEFVSTHHLCSLSESSARMEASSKSLNKLTSRLQWLSVVLIALTAVLILVSVKLV